MTWEEKLQAMQALCGTVTLNMRKPGDWYVSALGREVRRAGSGLLESTYGNGPTPMSAVENDWRLLVTELPEGAAIVLDAGRQTRRAFRWNGFMWEKVLT